MKYGKTVKKQQWRSQISGFIWKLVFCDVLSCRFCAAFIIEAMYVGLIFCHEWRVMYSNRNFKIALYALDMPRLVQNWLTIPSVSKLSEDRLKCWNYARGTRLAGRWLAQGPWPSYIACATVRPFFESTVQNTREALWHCIYRVKHLRLFGHQSLACLDGGISQGKTLY